jgi:hypothetical protein
VDAHSPPAAAQAVRATVLGTVNDLTGAVLPGATVTVTNTDTRVVQTTVSDSQGHYTVTNLLPGPYDIEAALSGFQTIVRNGVRLVVGSESVVAAHLAPRPPVSPCDSGPDSELGLGLGSLSDR